MQYSKLKRKVFLLQRSADRLGSELAPNITKGDRFWWSCLKAEVIVHLKRTLETLWLVLRKVRD